MDLQEEYNQEEEQVRLMLRQLMCDYIHQKQEHGIPFAHRSEYLFQKEKSLLVIQIQVLQEHKIFLQKLHHYIS